MNEIKTRPGSKNAANFGFSAFVFVVFGWINLEVLLFMHDAHMGSQVSSCAFGLYLCMVAYRRCRLSWSALTRSSRAPVHDRAFGTRNMVSVIALAAGGFALACLLRTGLVTAVVIGAALFMLIPWARNSYLRKNFMVAQVIFGGGGLPVFLIAARHQDPLIVVAQTWVLWTLAAGLLLIAAWADRPKAPPHDENQVASTVCETGVR
jgi:hypothetical protein